MEFKKEEQPINIGADISLKSFEMIEKELNKYPKIKEFSIEQKEVISRLIHTTTCFEEVSENYIEKIQDLLKSGAKIIVNRNVENNALWLKNVHKSSDEKWKELFGALSKNINIDKDIFLRVPMSAKDKYKND